MSSIHGNGERIDSLEALISMYLAVGMPLVEGKLQDEGIRRALQIFILGIVDFVSQAEDLAEQEFHLLIDRILKSHGLDDYPPDNLCHFAPQWIKQHPRFEQIMRMGAQSIQRYYGEKDAQAPLDLAQVVLFTEMHPEEVGGDDGSTA